MVFDGTVFAVSGSRINGSLTTTGVDDIDLADSFFQRHVEVLDSNVVTIKNNLFQKDLTVEGFSSGDILNNHVLGEALICPTP